MIRRLVPTASLFAVLAAATACSSTPDPSTPTGDGGSDDATADPDVTAPDAADGASADATGSDAADSAVFDAGAADAAAAGNVVLSVNAVACQSGQWCLESPSIMVGFSPLHGAMSASGPNDIWWGGVTSSSPDNATLVHFNGAQWQRIKPSISGDFTAIWAQAPNSVWAGESFGFIDHFNGTSWTSFPSQNASRAVRAFWGASANDVWAAYEGGVIAHYQNGVWTPMTVAGNVAQADYYALGGTSVSDVWATGESGTIQHWNGAAWAPSSSGTTANLVGLYVAGPSSVYAVPFSTSEYPLYGNGSTWTPRPFPSPQSLWLRGAHGRTASDMYVVDDAGAVRHWNGSAWSVAQPTASALRSVYDAPSGEAWAVGPSVIAHYVP